MIFRFHIIEQQIYYREVMKAKPIIKSFRCIYYVSLINLSNFLTTLISKKSKKLGYENKCIREKSTNSRRKKQIQILF